MQSGGGGAQQGHVAAISGGYGWTPGSAALLSTSSSVVSTPHLGFDTMHQQQHQNQQLVSREPLQQQLLRRPEGNEALLAACQSVGVPRVMGGNNFASSSGSILMPQQSRISIDLAQQPGSYHIRDEGQNRSQSTEQQVFNPVHQAYLQYAYQVAHQKLNVGMQAQQQTNFALGTAPSGKAANQALSSEKTSEQLTPSENLMEKGQQLASDERNEAKLSRQQTTIGQLMPSSISKPMQAPQTHLNIQNMPSNQLAVAAQLQALQSWALERNIDLSSPANAYLMAQLFPFTQSGVLTQKNSNDNNVNGRQSADPVSGQQVASPSVASVDSPHGNSSSDMSVQSGSGKARQIVPPSIFQSTSNSTVVNNTTNTSMHQFPAHGHENQLAQRPPFVTGNGMPPMHPPQPALNIVQGVDQSLLVKNTMGAPEAQYLKKSNQSSSQSAGPPNYGSSGKQSSSQAEATNQMPQQRLGFTKQQYHVLKAQILAFRRLKKGDATLPQELLRAIAPSPLELQLQQAHTSTGTINWGRSVGKNVEGHARHSDAIEKDTQAVPSVCLQKDLDEKKDSFAGDVKATASTICMQNTGARMKEPVSVVSTGKEEQLGPAFVVTSEMEAEGGIPKTYVRSDLDKGKAVSPQDTVSVDQVKKPVQASNSAEAKDAGPTKKYHGPLFDFPLFTRKHDSFESSVTISSTNNLTLAYDVKDLLFEEGVDLLHKKRTDNINKIGGLLAVNLERKRIRPDTILRLQIEEKKMRLLDLRARLRDQIDQQQQEIMAMPDRPYRKFVRLCERQRMELARQVQVTQKATRDKQLKSIFQWRKKLLESHWVIRDTRTAHNRGVARYHERMLREFSKRKDDDRRGRMEALKNNDVQRYREMVMEQQTSIPGDAGERYAVLSSFLSQTEEYLHKLGGKITASKSQQEVEEAANAAAAAVQAQGLSEEEIRAAAACAGEEVWIRNRFSEMNAPKESLSVNKYYNLAHLVTERVKRQPSMLHAGTLRDYQLVGLQWMLSLYNKLNGILADEMGLGKTVQVMALIAYLMEFKGNYGPHLIIVPNAVLVNWKSEFLNWLPSVSCIFYVGQKDQRLKIFSQEVCALKFNVLVTTYEFIMYDRSKLSKVDWKYIIVDEAQRMKDRESVLACDLDRYRCQRRLLLTGTPLQNNLKELWALLNLLLPEVFDNRKAFHDWFSQPFQKEGTHYSEDDWLETEKKVVIIHRLHQILEPFMLRRRVEDVEGSLPPKVSIVLKCRMSAIQSSIYDWIKSTGTLRVDPEDEKRRLQKNPVYQAKIYRPLNNRCMELRKTCNHPLLNYPYFNDLSKNFLIRSCGKLWILDRILIKLQRTGHRVLLFSTMTRLLDILEEYLQWRRLVCRRIDGTTSLEDRESAIVDFNSPNSDCFIFLLSIRAAGRGLNLQSADTVVIYDPDSNPKNEEQAVARAHRIGQTREVKVIYMEAVVDKISSQQKEDDFRSTGAVDMEDDLAGKDTYMGSIESLIRNNIQQYKIDMADEVINAGRFDQRTTHEERRLTLETLLHDEERYQDNVHDVPSLQEVNRMIARSEEEVELFDQMDEELDWNDDMMRYDEVPDWLRASSSEDCGEIWKSGENSGRAREDLLGSPEASDQSPKTRGGKKGRRPKGRKLLSYAELDDENGEFSEASFEEKNGNSVHGGGEIIEFEYEETSDAVATDWAAPMNKDQLEDDGPVCDTEYKHPQAPESTRNDHVLEEAGSSGSSSNSRRLTQMVSLPSSLKFGSLSALDARPSSISKRMPDEPEEGEISVPGDSPMRHQQSGSWNHDHDDEIEDEQVLQPKVKRKRSIRLRPHHSLRAEDWPSNEKPSVHRNDSSHLPFQPDRKHEIHLRIDPEPTSSVEFHPFKHDKSDSLLRNKRTPPSRRNMDALKLHASPKSSRLNCMSASAEDASEHSIESRDGKVMTSSGTSNFGPRMSNIIQRKCKNVLSKLQKRIDEEGPQIVPLLTELWKRSKNSSKLSGAGNYILDFRKINQRVDRLEYNGVMDFVFDVQCTLKSALQFFGFSLEVRTEARKVHDLFFDIMKMAYPDADLREARNALSFSGPIATSSGTSRRVANAGQSQRQMLITPMINKAEHDPRSIADSLPHGSNPTSKDTRPRAHILQKESRLGSSSRSNNGEQFHRGGSPVLTHPGELVICKKRRKEREKAAAAAKLRAGSTGPVSQRTTRSSIRGPGPSSISSRDMALTQQINPQQGWINHGGGTSTGWANPVKRMRTDAGKRRPSHF